MCGRRSARSFIISFFLFCSLLASLPAGTSMEALSTSELESRLKEISAEQRSLYPELRERWQSLEEGLLLSSNLEKALQMQSEELQDLLETASSRSQSLEEQLADAGKTASSLEMSLEDTRSSMTNLSESLTSYFDATEKEIRGLKTQNAWLIALTAVAACIAGTAIFLR